MTSTNFREGYAIRDQFATHFLTFTVCGWIDLFTRKVYKEILVEALQFMQQKGHLLLYAYVIMSNHIHLLARADDGQKKTLSDIIRDYKKFTHHQMIPVIDSEAESRRQWMVHQFSYYGRSNPKNEAKQIWTNNNHPEECFTKAFTDSKLHYIHENPVRAGIVRNAEDYVIQVRRIMRGRVGDWRWRLFKQVADFEHSAAEVWRLRRAANKAYKSATQVKHHRNSGSWVLNKLQ